MDEKEEEFKVYGWKCNEDNLATLPETAPKAAKDLAEWLTLEGRRSSLAEWLGCIGDDGKIHGKFWHIGAWTGRMSHSSPNQANIPSILDRPPETAVEEVKNRYDPYLRALFKAEGDGWLVGCDADGIQLCILAHYMESEEYIKAIVTGDKKLGTDIHSLNWKALNSTSKIAICKSRDDAKTFIYAWLLGAGIAKIASILKCSEAQARVAVEAFLNSLPELKKLKREIIPRMAAKGGFTGLDGRWVPCTSEHLMLAGMLQNGEAVIMKHANVGWYDTLSKTSIPWKQVNFVHDEWQTLVLSPDRKVAERVGEIQARQIVTTGRQLKLKCPLSGTPKIGKNWKETH